MRLGNKPEYYDKRSEFWKNYFEKASDYYMKAILISPEGYLDYLIEFRKRIANLINKQKKVTKMTGFDPLLNKINDFINLLEQ